MIQTPNNQEKEVRGLQKNSSSEFVEFQEQFEYNLTNADGCGILYYTPVNFEGGLWTNSRIQKHQITI